MTEKTLKTGDTINYGQSEYLVLENRIEKGKAKNRALISINLIAILLIALMYAVYFAALSLFGLEHRPINAYFFQLLIYLAVYIISFIAFIVAHEYVHYLAYRLFGKIPKEKLKFGIAVKSVMAYCIALEPVSIKASKISLMMPVYLLVVPVAAAAVILQSGFMVFLAAMFFSGSGGDIWYMWTLRKDSADKYIIETMPANGDYELGYLLLEKIK